MYPTPFNYSRHFQMGAFVFPYVLGSEDPLDFFGLSRTYMAFCTFPDSKSTLPPAPPRHSVFILRYPQQGLSLFLGKPNYQKVHFWRANTGCKHRHTVILSKTKQQKIHINSFYFTLCRPTGNWRMLILDVKGKISFKLNH